MVSPVEPTFRQQRFDELKAALLLSWNNGQTDGQIHQLNLLKRQMYGRAGRSLTFFAFVAWYGPGGHSRITPTNTENLIMSSYDFLSFTKSAGDPFCCNRLIKYGPRDDTPVPTQPHRSSFARRQSVAATFGTGQGWSSNLVAIVPDAHTRPPSDRSKCWRIHLSIV
jgi:hypothetical protein